jgi:hypothetical protein
MTITVITTGHMRGDYSLHDRSARYLGPQTRAPHRSSSEGSEAPVFDGSTSATVRCRL